ncbi:MAG: hypothetical protein V3T40_01805 [Nitrososphaerales archaeon]
MPTDVFPGIVIIVTKLPDGSVVRVAIVVEPSLIVMGLFGLKSEPKMVMGLPAIPALEDNVTTPDLIIVNNPEAGLPNASSADMVVVPIAIPVGIVMVAVKLPDGVVTMLDGIVASVVELSFITSGAFAAKPVPVTITDVLVGPEFVDNVIVCDVTETSNITGATNIPSVMEIKCLPAVAVLGILKVATNILSVEGKRGGIVEIVNPSNFMLILLSGLKFEPETVTVVPGIPLSGVIIATGKRTMNVA